MSSRRTAAWPAVDRKAEEAKPKGQMRCPLTGEELVDMEAVKLHLGSPPYQARLRAIKGDLVFSSEERTESTYTVGFCDASADRSLHPVSLQK